MGSQNSFTAKVSKQQATKLNFAFPLNTHSQLLTEVHQIFSHSPEHHKVILETIRTKKNYDCRFLVRILDSHTIQSENMCSTIIKTYVVIEKPQSLQEEIEYRIENSMGFDEKQLWTILYSCVRGALFLHQNQVNICRLNPNKIYIDYKGDIKIADPQLSNNFSPNSQNCQQEIISEITHVIRSLMALKKNEYSPRLLQTLTKCEANTFNLLKLLNWIDTQYLNNEQTIPVSSFRSSFSSKKMVKSVSKAKRALTVMSISNQNSSKKNPQTLKLNKSKKNKLNSSVNSFRTENKENEKSNDFFSDISDCQKQHKGIYGAKKTIQTVDLKLENIMDHNFPRKALFSQRRKRQPSTNILKLGDMEETRAHQMNEQQVSKEMGKKIKMISFKVDHETSVCQMSSQHSEYLAELLNDKSQCLE